MSSYFDTMARCAQSKEELFLLVKRQYMRYFEYLSDECLKADFDKVWAFGKKLNGITIKESEMSLAVDLAIQEIHDLAHEVGSAGIRLRGGRRAGDNPLMPFFTY